MDLGEWASKQANLNPENPDEVKSEDMSYKSLRRMKRIHKTREDAEADNSDSVVDDIIQQINENFGR
jgi:hypothetical protein